MSFRIPFNAVQKAFYERLTSELPDEEVADHLAPGKSRRRIVLGEFTGTSEGRPKGEDGYLKTEFTVHAFEPSMGAKALNDLMDLIAKAIGVAPLEFDDFDSTEADLEFVEAFVEEHPDDGSFIRHGVLKFRFVTQAST